VELRACKLRLVQPASEVFRDPGSGKPMRVWYNPATGEREYRED